MQTTDSLTGTLMTDSGSEQSTTKQHTP